jgi:hypothetical protein
MNIWRPKYSAAIARASATKIEDLKEVILEELIEFAFVEFVERTKELPPVPH